MEPTREQSRQANVVHVDLTDPTYNAMCTYAGRISKLLTAPAAQADPNVAGSLDDFLGVVHALILAKQGDFEDRTSRSIEIAVVQKRAEQMRPESSGGTESGWPASTSTARCSARRPSTTAS